MGAQVRWQDGQEPDRPGGPGLAPAAIAVSAMTVLLLGHRRPALGLAAISGLAVVGIRARSANWLVRESCESLIGRKWEIVRFPERRQRS